MTGEPTGQDVWQCHGCNRVWTPDATSADGGEWTPSDRRLEGVPHKYCPKCLAAREAAMAGLSHSAEEVVERHEEPAAPAVVQPHASSAEPNRASLLRPVVWVVLALVMAAVVGAHFLWRGGARTQEEEPVAGPSRVGGEVVAPVGGAWMARGQEARRTPGKRTTPRYSPMSGGASAPIPPAAPVEQSTGASSATTPAESGGDTKTQSSAAGPSVEMGFAGDFNGGGRSSEAMPTGLPEPPPIGGSEGVASEGQPAPGLALPAVSGEEPVPEPPPDETVPGPEPAPEPGPDVGEPAPIEPGLPAEAPPF